MLEVRIKFKNFERSGHFIESYGPVVPPLVIVVGQNTLSLDQIPAPSLADNNSVRF
jgi:hypothetical protein